MLSRCNVYDRSGEETDVRTPDIGCVQQMETVGKLAFKVICGSINI
jgi:hypothetical protein